MKVFYISFVVFTLIAFAHPAQGMLEVERGTATCAEGSGGHDHHGLEPHECSPLCDCPSQPEISTMWMFSCRVIATPHASTRLGIANYIDPKASRHGDPVWQPPKTIA